MSKNFLGGVGRIQPPLPRHSPEQPILMKIGKHTLLCILKRLESKNCQKNLHRVGKWAWKGRLCLRSASKGQIPEKWFFGRSSSGFDLRPKILAHSSCSSMRQNFFVFWTFFYDELYGRSRPFWISQKSHLPTLGAPSAGPICRRVPKLLPKLTYGIHLKSQSII